MISVLFIILFLIGSLTFIFTGNVSNLNKSLITSIISGFDLLKVIIPGIILWSGLMKIAEDSNLLSKFSMLLMPLLKRLFPSIPPGNKALDYISSNIAANVLGLGSVATPFGLKAMKELQKINLNKDEASHAMQTFLVINTAGVTIVPSMVITLRLTYQSINPFIILIPSILITFLSCLFGIIINYLWSLKNE
jgi:spore maturation protein A